MTRSLVKVKVARTNTGFAAHTVPNGCFGAIAVKPSETLPDVSTVALFYTKKLCCDVPVVKHGPRKLTSNPQEPGYFYRVLTVLTSSVDRIHPQWTEQLTISDPLLSYNVPSVKVLRSISTAISNVQLVVTNGDGGITAKV